MVVKECLIVLPRCWSPKPAAAISPPGGVPALHFPALTMAARRSENATRRAASLGKDHIVSLYSRLLVEHHAGSTHAKKAWINCPEAIGRVCNTQIEALFHVSTPGCTLCLFGS